MSVVVLVIWIWRVCGPGHPARTGGVLSLFFMLSEAAVGAGLVLFRLVADNASMARALFMAVHLLNTFILLACIALTAWWLSRRRSRVRTSVPSDRQPPSGAGAGTGGTLDRPVPREGR